jgi:hypothetical protein
MGGRTPRITTAVCGVVEIESVTICGVAPGVTGNDGVKVAFVPAGSGVEGDILNVTGSENVPLVGERVNANFAVSPAVIVGGEVAAATE